MESFTHMKNDNLKKNLANIPRNKSYEQNLSHIIFDPSNANKKTKFMEKLEQRYKKLD